MAGDEVGECLFDWSAHFVFLVSSASRSNLTYSVQSRSERRGDVAHSFPRFFVYVSRKKLPSLAGFSPLALTRISV